MGTRRSTGKTLHALALAALLGALSAPAAAGPVSAEVLLSRDDAKGARTALAAWVDAGTQEPAGLLRAALIARELDSIEILRSIRAAAERLEEARTQDGEAGAPSEAREDLDLALGFAYLGLAEQNLRLATGSRSISLYFADAEARATKVPAGSSRNAQAARLQAEARYAQGDLEGAIAVLTTGRGKDLDTPSGQVLRGTYLYERGAAVPVGADGRPAPEAAADLAAARAWLGQALESEARPPLSPAAVRRAQLTRAYAAHRLGDVPSAEADYLAAYAKERDEARLALRGLESLFGNDPEGRVAALAQLAREKGADLEIVKARVAALQKADEPQKALAIARAWHAEHEGDAPANFLLGQALQAAEAPDEAVAAYLRTLRLDPAHQGATYGVETVAQGLAPKDFDRTLAIYEALLPLRPKDPYVRNNIGFLLREHVSPQTDTEEGGLQRLRPDAPPGTRERLERCVALYAEAAALIDPALDGTREVMLAWDLAGIVNDYGLMLHYFVDVQDPQLAEAQYLRALRMTDSGFKDTYSPNLHRLYRYVLVDQPLRWYRAAREARQAILQEAQGADGRVVLVPDERKREAAQRDMETLRARILQELKDDAIDDGLSWPPAGEGSGK